MRAVPCSRLQRQDVSGCVAGSPNDIAVDTVHATAAALKSKLGSSLFGFDILVETRTGASAWDFTSLLLSTRRHLLAHVFVISLGSAMVCRRILHCGPQLLSLIQGRA